MVDGAFQDAVDNFLAFDSENRRLTIGRGMVKALYLDDKRNELVRDFLQTTGDYLMMLDTDIEFQPHQIYGLVDEAVENDRQILAGMYFSFLTQKQILSPVWFSSMDEGGCLKTFGSFKAGEVIVPLIACGMGFTLIRRDVFETIAKCDEWASDDWTWFGRDTYVYRLENGKTLSKRYGEDTCFCVRSRQCGIQTWGHKGVVVRHWKKVPVDFRMFRAFVELARLEGAEM